MIKYYVNVEDRQGGSWAMGRLQTIKEWQENALEWCDSDDNDELYEYIEKHDLNEELIDVISDYWDIKIVPFDVEHVEEISKAYGYSYNYGDLKDLLSDIMERGVSI